MGVPKRKTSKMKRRQRQSSHKKALPAVNVCKQCGAPKQPHRVCPACGSYGGRKAIIVDID